MANMFSVQKVGLSKLRKAPFLPRVGLTLEVAGRQFSFRYAPFLETLLVLRERGYDLRSLPKIAGEIFDEIKFPSGKRPLAPVKDLQPREGANKVKKGATAKAAKRKATAKKAQSVETSSSAPAD